jgi:HK97 family phage prohead protease
MNTNSKILNNRFHRTIEIKQSEQTDNGLVIEIAASSDLPYRRSFGYETLLHTEDAIDYTRVPAGSCPVLYNHNCDQYIGIVESVRLVPGQLRAVIRLSKNSDFARQVTADIMDGILKSISIGYEINEMTSGPEIDGVPQYMATKWTLYEISVVTTPADYLKAGIGRNDKQIHEEIEMEKRDVATILEMIDTLTPEELAQVEDALDMVVGDAPEVTNPAEVTDTKYPVPTMATANAMETPAPAPGMVEASDVTTPPAPIPSASAADVSSTYKAAPKATYSRSTIIGDNMSNQNNGSDNGADQSNTLRLVELANKYERTADLSTWISEGRTAADVALEILETKSNASKISGPAIHIKSEKKVDFAGAVQSWLKGNNSELAERGLDQARNAGTTVNSNTLYIPTDVEMINASRMGRMVTRDGTAYSNTGQYGVGKEFLTWEQTLREGALLSRVGGQILALNDVASMPYFATPTTASAFFETGSVTDSEVTVGIRNWSPKRLAARYTFSNLMGRLNGTYDFEADLYTDLLAEGVRIFDAQIWGGTGTNSMTGLSQDTNITALNLSGSFNLASGSAMITQVAKANANVANGAFVLAHDVYSQAFATPAYGAASGMSTLALLEAQNPVFRTGYIPAPGAGKAGAMFGDFSKVTAATFGPIEIKRDDITKLQTGQTVLTFEMFADCIARQPAALVRWNNITI